MGLLDEVKGSKKVGLTGAGCGAANVDAADRALWAEDHGAARDGYRVGVMTDLDARYVGNRVVQQKPSQPDREGSLYLYFQPGPALYGCRPLGLCMARGCDAYRRSRSAAGAIVAGGGVGFKPVQPFGRFGTRRGFIQLWGLGFRSVCWEGIGDGRRLLDDAPVHVPRVLRRPGARAPGPLLPLLRPVALHTPDMGRDLQGQQVRVRLRGVGCTAIGRQGGPSSVRCRASCRRNVSKFAGATRSA